MPKDSNDLNLSDEPLRPAMPRDVVAIARNLAAAMRQAPGRDKNVIALYRAPDYLRWGVESLSEAVTAGVLEPAANALLDVGLSAIRGFSGVSEVGKARAKLVVRGDPQVMHWLNNFPVISVPAVDTDDSKAYRLWIETTLVKEFSKLARSLGLSISRLGTFALMAGLLHVPPPWCSRPRYREAMVGTLKKLMREIKGRGDEASARVDSAAPRDPSQDHRWTIADLLGPGTDERDEDDG
jgi:hypothetical protein